LEKENKSIFISGYKGLITNQKPAAINPPLMEKKPRDRSFAYVRRLAKRIIRQIPAALFDTPYFFVFYAGINKDGTGPYRKAEAGKNMPA
jgi:hypothetical protein